MIDAVVVAALMAHTPSGLIDGFRLSEPIGQW